VPLNALADLGDGTPLPPNALLAAQPMQPAPTPQPVQADPYDMTARYNTPLSPADEAAFQAWGQQQEAQGGRNPAADVYDYDMRGFWKSGAQFAPNGHGGDEFKKPNHPTFSTFSNLHGVDGNQGGTWTGDGQSGTFTPGATNLQFHGPGDLQQYFQQTEPNHQLILPPQPTR
jgi:hypothetical protein